VASRVLDDSDRRGIDVVVLGDERYPRALLDLDLPPPVLFCRGRLPDRPGVAVVGSRSADPYGLEATALFAGALASAGLVVVSGLARGIDSAAHRAATRDPFGRTIAVLGCGLDVDYPRGSRSLRREIERQGVIVTEFPAGTPALPYNFPIRNRIIAALGVCCLVVQAASKSGSLVTAREAMRIGRDVWAVPGRIFDRRFQGTNQLIRDGASPALVPRHLLEALPLAVQEALQRARAELAAERVRTAAGASCPAGARGASSQLGARLLSELVTGEPATAEAIAGRCGAGVDRVLAALLELELQGRVARLPGPRFVRKAAPWEHS
jgi:DNA processing protein